MQDKEMKQRSNSAYSFAVRDGKLVWHYAGIGTLTFDASKASATNRARAMMHGFKQRIIDAAALDADKATGKTDPQAKYDEMKRVIDHLESGAEEWNLKPQASTSTAASYVTKALIALGTYQDHDVSDAEKANAFVQKVSKIEKLGLKGEMGKARDWLEKSSKTIRDKIAELRAAETPAVDADAALGELMGEGEPADEPEAETQAE